MTAEHPFIFTPGVWIGHGKITFSVSPDSLHFCTKWTVDISKGGVITCVQEVETEGRDQLLINRFSFSAFTNEAFSVELGNELIDGILGKGIVDPTTIAWEFRGGQELEGFEVYEIQSDGTYSHHAEFASLDNYRTIVHGKIWKKEDCQSC